MDNELELEGLVPEENNEKFISPKKEEPKDKENLSDRWASWINIVNK